MPDETLLLSNEDQERLITFEDMLGAIEDAYTELGRNEAHSIPRRRIYTPKDDRVDDYHWFNIIPGVVPGSQTAAVRVDSATVRATDKRGNARFEFPGAFSGLVYLYDTESTELLAILQDFYLNPVRVAATSALVSRHIAPTGAEVMGVFGSGTMATTQIEYHCEIRDLDEVRVYSTAPDRREAFADRLDGIVEPTVVPVREPRNAVGGCDIVTTATNANEPVFDGELLEPGTHLNVVTPSNDRWFPRREIDEAAILAADLIVTNSIESMKLDDQIERRLVQRGQLSWDQIYEIGDVLTGETFGRTNDNAQITYHSNNVGMGIQFAAIGRRIYEKAKAQGIGTPVDMGHFMQTDDEMRAVRDRGFLLKDLR